MHARIPYHNMGCVKVMQMSVTISKTVQDTDIITMEDE